MQWLSRTPNFNFMGHKWVALAISGTLVLVSLVAFAVRGLNLGLDFTGGILLEVEYGAPVELEDVRRRLAAEGYEDAIVQTYGTTQNVMIRLPPPPEAAESAEAGAAVGNAVLESLQADGSDVRLLRTEVVGSQVGDDLTEQGGLAMLFAMLLTTVYIMLRFRWKFAVGAGVATVHDVIVTVGFFAVTGITFDLTVLASVLAVIGYSLNDTIVVYDRIRENFRLLRRGSTEEIINKSVNQTLARTLMTGVTTLLVLAGLIFLGGETMFGFSIALIVGIVVGTLSSIYVASIIALLLDVSPVDLVPPKREAID